MGPSQKQLLPKCNYHSAELIQALAGMATSSDEFEVVEGHVPPSAGDLGWIWLMMRLHRLFFKRRCWGILGRCLQEYSKLKDTHK